MPGNYQAVTITKQPQRIQSWLAPNEAFLFVNNDITNAVFIGNDQSSQPIPIPALGSVTLTSVPGHDTWISTGGVNVSVQGLLLPQGSNWTPSPAQVAAQINALGLAKDVTVAGVNTTLGAPAQNATVSGVTTAVNATPAANASQIAANGVPLLRKTTTLGSGAAVTLTPGLAVQLLTNAAINQPSFEALFSLWQPAATGTNPFAVIVFNWFDSASGFAVASKFYTITSGNAVGNQMQYYMSGPCYGDQLSVAITDLEGATNQTLQAWVVNATSHTHTKDIIYQPVYPVTAPVGFTNPNGTPAAGVLFASNPTIAANGALTRLLAVYNGVIDMVMDNAGQAANAVIQLVDPSGQLSGTVNQELYTHTLTAGNRDTVEWSLPNGPVALVMRNTSTTTAITVNLSATKRNEP